MSVYVVAQLKFKDEPACRRYQAAAAELFLREGVRVLAADEAPTRLEGGYPYDKIVIMQFADAAAARGFLEGADYQRISADRVAGAETTAILVNGF